MLPIRIAVGEVSLDGELNDTECARALARALPVTADFQVWGDELHFDVSLDGDLGRHGADAVSPGDMGFWREGGRLCIFFGPTPKSPAEDPVAAVPVIIVGRVESAERLRGAKEAGEITVQARNGRRG